MSTEDEEGCLTPGVLCGCSDRKFVFWVNLVCYIIAGFIILFIFPRVFSFRGMSAEFVCGRNNFSYTEVEGLSIEPTIMHEANLRITMFRGTLERPRMLIGNEVLTNKTDYEDIV